MFISSDDLVWHRRYQHSGDDLKPTPEPFKPSLPARLPPVPNEMPTFMHEARDVRLERVSTARHAQLGPWVSPNCSFQTI
jgi:hypothetical protein